MKKQIWKFNTVPNGRFEGEVSIRMPKGAEILTTQTDKKDNTPCIWALVDPYAEIEERLFEMYGTGHDIHYDMGVERKYIGTYQYQKGEFIGHIFERIN